MRFDVLQDTDSLTGACPNKISMEQYLKLTLDDGESLKINKIQTTCGTTDIPHG